MAFWWVNQNQTYEHEISGGYMWSPKKNSNGAYNQFYENMQKVEPGDVVFSYRRQHISDIGVVQDCAHSESKPGEFGQAGDYWSNAGWLVPVRWFKLQQPIYPKSNFDELRPTLPSKYSPLSANTGDGLQSVYLADVPDAMAAVLLRKLSADDHKLVSSAGSMVSGGQEFEDSFEDEIQARIEQDITINSTEREAVVKARKGQGRYRQNLERLESACRITGVIDKRLLRASHIKPWRLCKNNHERLDGNNGLLLSPSIDLLFDQGFISFEDNGRLLISTRVNSDQLAALGVPLDNGFRTQPFNHYQQTYLAFHRKHVFKG